MATKKKFYAVKVGKITGIFDNWNDCKASVDGFAKAQYKGFATLAEAKEYMGDNGNQKSNHQSSKYVEFDVAPEVAKSEKELLVYVDGSYHDGLKKYAFGCIFILPDGRIFTECGNGNNPDSLVYRNVTGEMLGAMYAVKTAIKNGYEKIEICYDYEGIEKWVTGAWRSKNEHTQKYAEAMRGWMRQIQIKFTKVVAHSNVEYNELADQTAKKGLTDAQGIPTIHYWEEMQQWNG